MPRRPRGQRQIGHFFHGQHVAIGSRIAPTMVLMIHGMSSRTPTKSSMLMTVIIKNASVLAGVAV